MKQSLVTEAVARRFLLGAVDDPERQEIESLLVMDPAVKETILIAEDQLVEDYLEGNLSKSDTAKFIEQYSHSPAQRRGLRITETIKTHALEEARSTQLQPATLQNMPAHGSSFWERHGRRHVPIAVAATLVLAISVFWLLRWNDLRIQENKQRSAVERALAELNTPASLGQNPTDMVSLTLPSVSLRSINSNNEVKTRASDRLIELQLLRSQTEEAPSYTAILRRIGGENQYRIADLHQEKTLAGSIVKLRLPAQALSRGHYQLTLTPLASNGSTGPVEEYEFVISK